MKITQTLVFIFIAVPELKKNHKPLYKGSRLVDDPQALHRQNITKHKTTTWGVVTFPC